MFIDLLRKELISSLGNYFHDNYDAYTHGKVSFAKRLINMGKFFFYNKLVLGTLLKSDYFYQQLFLRKVYGLDKHVDGLNFFYDKLADENSKQLLLKLMAFRILGYVKVKLPLSNPEYWNGIKKLDGLVTKEEKLKLNCFPWQLEQFDLTKSGTPVKVYFNPKGAYTTFCLKQYEYKNNNNIVKAEAGDVVLDLGGCYGDTGLFFANETGSNGKVYVFEFIPDNISVIEKNLEKNSDLKNTIQVVDNPVWETSNKEVYFISKGAASKVSMVPIENCDGKKYTISIDDFVKENHLAKVNFIKTDIEGAEPFALRGAVNTLRSHKPKLAISIYHNMSDFVNIIKYISDLNLGYKFYLGHFTIYASETVLFAKV